MQYQIIVYIDTEGTDLRKTDVERIRDVVQAAVPMANVDLCEVDEL